jgi:hypothetical protein
LYCKLVLGFLAVKETYRKRSALFAVVFWPAIPPLTSALIGLLHREKKNSETGKNYGQDSYGRVGEV